MDGTGQSFNRKSWEESGLGKEMRMLALEGHSDGMHF